MKPTAKKATAAKKVARVTVTLDFPYELLAPADDLNSTGMQVLVSALLTAVLIDYRVTIVRVSRIRIKSKGGKG